jgi:hypothetical protein
MHVPRTELFAKCITATAQHVSIVKHIHADGQFRPQQVGGVQCICLCIVVQLLEYVERIETYNLVWILHTILNHTSF